MVRTVTHAASSSVSWVSQKLTCRRSSRSHTSTRRMMQPPVRTMISGSTAPYADCMAPGRPANERSQPRKSPYTLFPDLAAGDVRQQVDDRHVGDVDERLRPDAHDEDRRG